MIERKPANILIIDDNSPFVLSILRSYSDCPKFQLDVLVGSLQKPNYFKYSRYLRNVYKELPFTEENFGRTLKEYIGKSSADLIIPTREWISKLVDRHREELQKIVRIHPVSDLNTIETLNDKWKLNNWLETNNFPCSLARQFTLNPEDDYMLGLFSFPILLKPSISQGGVGIKLIRSKENLKSTIIENETFGKNYIIQEYITGYDIGINIFSINGKILCHTIQRGLFSGQFSFSRGTEFVKNPELFDLTSAIVSRLKYTGVANLDFRYDINKGTYILIDFNARYWSTLDGSKFMGVNFPVLVTEYSLGRQPSYPDYSTGTYYCANEAISTFIRNLFSRTKYPINLLHTKLSVILKDPVPEVVQSGDQIINKFKKVVSRIIR
jgi:predicted ATP-grasp superfamily ATP-dependent carboligase